MWQSFSNEAQRIVRFRFLTVTGSVYGRPIKGQYEVAATKRESRSCYWKTSEGAFIKPDDGPTKVQNGDDDDDFDDHDEL